MKKRDLVYGSLITLFGIFIFIYAGKYASTIDLGSGSTGGEFFPRMMSAGLVITGIAILIKALNPKTEDESVEPILWVELLINISALVIFYLLFKPLGFIVDAAWITAFVMYRFGCRNYKAIVIWSIVMPSAIFCVFYYLLYVGLPLGVLSPILPRY